jgi:uncharacterized damage-inducible protein DinB
MSTRNIAAALVPELDHELPGLRKTVERIPDNLFDWRPHPKSFTMSELANHLVNMVNWVGMIMNTDSFDFAPVDGPEYTEPKGNTTRELLDMLDEYIVKTRAIMNEADDMQYMMPWSMIVGGKEIMSMPRVAVYRSFVMNHLIHHRAQLTMYLRLNDIPVPALYGPSADEQGMM